MRSILPVIVLFLAACANTLDQDKQAATDLCSGIHRNDSISLTKELAPYADQMKSKTGVYVLEDGDNAMLSRAWLCEYAEKSIDIQYFIFSTDNVGLIACDYLVRAADRGVKVRILVDDIMVEATPEQLLMMDSHPNIDIRIYNPGVNTGKNIVQKLTKLAGDPHGFNQRMHNKTFVIDGKVAITGGRNIADEYFDYDHEYNFRDRDVLLIGKTAADISLSFGEYWADERSVKVSDLVKGDGPDLNDPHRFDRLHQYACDPQNYWPQVREKLGSMPQLFHTIASNGELEWTDRVEFIPDVPGKNEDREQRISGRTTDSLMALVLQAKYSIDIQSPYLIVTALGKKVFADAVKRGVKVRILTNSLASTDNLEAFSGYQQVRKELLKTGVRIFEFKPDAKERFTIMTGALQKKMDFTPVFGLHAKSMVIDGRITVIGTFNLDPRSAHLNTECVTVIRSEKIAQGVLAGMEIEFGPDNAWETTGNFNPDSYAGKKKELKTWSRKVFPKEIL